MLRILEPEGREFESLRARHLLVASFDLAGGRAESSMQRANLD